MFDGEVVVCYEVVYFRVVVLEVKDNNGVSFICFCNDGFVVREFFVDVHDGFACVTLLLSVHWFIVVSFVELFDVSGY